MVGQALLSPVEGIGEEVGCCGEPAPAPGVRLVTGQRLVVHNNVFLVWEVVRQSRVIFLVHVFWVRAKRQEELEQKVQHI